MSTLHSRIQTKIELLQHSILMLSSQVSKQEGTENRDQGDKRNPCFNFSARGNSYFRRLVLNKCRLKLLSLPSLTHIAVQGESIILLIMFKRCLNGLTGCVPTRPIFQRSNWRPGFTIASMTLTLLTMKSGVLYMHKASCPV